MNPGEVIVKGVVRPDGALEVTERISLAPGPVRVINQPLPAAVPTSLPESINEFRPELAMYTIAADRQSGPVNTTKP